VAHDERLILAADVGGTNSRFAAFAVATALPASCGNARGRPGTPRASRSSLPRRSEPGADAPTPRRSGSPARSSTACAGPRTCRGRSRPRRWRGPLPAAGRPPQRPRGKRLGPRGARPLGRRRPPSRAARSPRAPRPGLRRHGLGEAGVLVEGAAHRPFASEGGHATFSPTEPLDADLWAHLARRFGHVSFERVVSGPGLVNLYGFLREVGRAPEASPLPAARAPEEITRRASEGTCALSRATVETWVRLYGVEAGNLASS